MHCTRPLHEQSLVQYCVTLPGISSVARLQCWGDTARQHNWPVGCSSRVASERSQSDQKKNSKHIPPSDDLEY